MVRDFFAKKGEKRQRFTRKSVSFLPLNLTPNTFPYFCYFLSFSSLRMCCCVGVSSVLVAGWFVSSACGPRPSVHCPFPSHHARARLPRPVATAGVCIRLVCCPLSFVVCRPSRLSCSRPLLPALYALPLCGRTLVVHDYPFFSFPFLFSDRLCCRGVITINHVLAPPCFCASRLSCSFPLSCLVFWPVRFLACPLWSVRLALVWSGVVSLLSAWPSFCVRVCVDTVARSCAFSCLGCHGLSWPATVG